MALATRCPNCHALFRVAADQLKLRGGLVRCSACRHIFDATGTLSYIDDASLSPSPHAAAPAVGAVIAAIRKAESTASESLSAHGGAAPPPVPSTAQPAPDTPLAAEETDAGAPPYEAAPDAEASAAETLPTGSSSDLAGDAADAAAQVHHLAEEEPREEAGTADTPAVAEPASATFLQEADTRDRRRRAALLGIGAILLAILVLAQLAVAFRAELLAKVPQSRPALEGLCRVFRCTVDWPARGDLLAVVGSELQALPGTSALELTAVVRNRGNMTLALPSIELTLSDTLNRTVARRVFVPADYLAGERDPQAHLRAGLEAGADLTVRIAFEANGLNAAGFVVYPFYL